MTSTPERASAYLSKLPPAIAGQGGHRATFAAACRLVEFGLSYDEALPILQTWNATHCQPPWSDSELEHKLRSAFAKTKPHPKFTARIDAPRSRPPSPPVTIPAWSGVLDLRRCNLTLGTPGEIAALAVMRHVSIEAVALAVARGLVRFGEHRGLRVWFVCDGSKRIASARRMDGQLWGNVKALLIPGSQGAWPMGIQEAATFPCVALVEGAPDLLAAHECIARERREHDCAAVAMASGSMLIHPDALPHFKGKRVRIFPHTDANQQGEQAAAKWSAQLALAGAVVDCHRLPTKDLNEFTTLHTDEKVLP